MALHIMLDLSHLNTINTCSHSLGTVHKTLLGGAEEWRIVFVFSIDCSQRETYNDNDNDNDNILSSSQIQLWASTKCHCQFHIVHSGINRLTLVHHV